MRRRSVFAMAVALALLVVPLVVAPASARSSARAEHDRVVAYWTGARMAAAKPRDFVREGNKLIPNRKPGSGGGATVTGASFAGNGEVRDRVGKVYFHMAGGDWQCSGSVVTDSGRSGYSMVLTAGHCAIDETTGEFATNWLFMPSWDRQPATFSTACSGSLYGCWTTAGGGGLYVDNDFATAGSFNDQAVTHDWAFAVVGPGGLNGSTQLDSVPAIGAGYALGINSVAKNDRLAAFGFPAAGKYHGNDLTYCAGPVGTDPGTGNATWSLACDMTGGSSGGGWLEGLNESNGNGGVLSSLNSYGYSGVRNMYGPKFNGETNATYKAAKSGTPANTRT